MVDDRYEAHKKLAAARNRAMALSGREIGAIPPCANPKRRDEARLNYRAFCESYFPATFFLPWSRDHLRVIAKIEQAVLRGGLFALAMPRGSGKSSLAETACIWAVLYGHRNFVALIGAEETHATDMLDAIRTEFETNELLLSDFPEAVFPIRCLDGIANRCVGQLHDGERTHISWTSREIVLPTVKGSAASGAVIKAAGITGRIRGMKVKRPDGRTVRPSLVVIDDPQTDESARSVSQCATREGILAGAVLGLAGPGTKISGIMPCTVIHPGDMADRILDNEKHPEWNGERTKMVYAFPRNEGLWQQYADIRAESLRAGNGGVEATEFYRANREAMDEGAIVAWPERYNPDELSAIQHAMNLRLQDERAFFAEYQNDPRPMQDQSSEILTAEQIARKVNQLGRRQVPGDATRLTMFIDLHQSLLYYVVCAWSDDFTGGVIDYGTYPEQRARYFTLATARPTLQQATKIQSLEAAIYAGLDCLTSQVLSLEYTRTDDTKMRIERCLVDANWGQTTDVVYQFCRVSPFASILMPSHGKYVDVMNPLMPTRKPKPGERVGLNWRIPSTRGRHGTRYALFDVNFWKSFVHARLAVPLGGRGCLSLWGDSPVTHRMFSEHLTAEFCVEGKWKLNPSAGDNHWFDCLVGCAVGASMQGSSLLSTDAQQSHRTQRVSFAAMQRSRASK